MSSFYYLLSIQFLGFRYSGWQKQTNAKTVQEMVDRTFRFVFDHENFKTLAAGRTDAKVSAHEFFFELFVHEKINKDEMIANLNKNLPPDIKVLSMVEVTEDFNVIQNAKIKEYVYLFTNETKMHPFCAPLMVSFSDSLDITLMQEGARLFQGIHSFEKYCYKPSAETVFEREIILSEVVANTLYSASFFPKESWLFRVKGKGFLRHQIRLMMGALVELGQKNISLKEFQESLNGGDNKHLGQIVPSSGLSLNHVEFVNPEEAGTSGN